MTGRKSFLLVAVLALACGGCGMFDNDEPLPTPVNINNINVNTNTNTNNNHVPATVKPGDETSLKPIARVEVSQFGEQCPAGSGPATWVIGGPRLVHRGCTGFITCTPRDADGVAVAASVHGPAPDAFLMTSGPTGTAAAQQSNPFNIDVRAGQTAGTASFMCIVKGITSQPWSLEIQ